jgi:hypothetical protein
MSVMNRSYLYASFALIPLVAVLAIEPTALAQQTAPSGQTQPAQGQPGQGGRGDGGQGVVGGVGAGRGRNTAPPRPAPRNADGRVILGGATMKEKGLWLPVFGILDPIAPAATVPFQPWAKAVYNDRQKHELEPHTRCKPSGVARQFLTPYGVEFVELPELQRIYIFDVGGPHTYRTIYMDGRPHPPTLTPTYYGHSIGWWEGDTLLVDTTGFNENFWLDRRGLPHTDKMRTLEKFTRADSNTINYEVTVNDIGAYTAPWSGKFNLRWENGTELFEYVCQQANYAGSLMVGDQESVDRSSPIIP